ncbi:hypothetical protein QPJ96_00050 [Pantoea agglomerans]|nr:hypothetical protein [Pantoea agglomerans]WIL42009.1 hypothetical protein QPJ96_00050 [Pantoea agglomerans]
MKNAALAAFFVFDVSGCTGSESIRLEFMSCLKKRAAPALFSALSYNAYKGRVSEDF